MIFKRNTILFFLFSALLLAGNAVSVHASSRLFFSAMVEPNEDAGNHPQVVLQWGALNGAIPSEIAKFRLYRSVNGGNNTLLTEINYTPESVDTAAITQLIDNDLSWRKTALLDNLQGIRNGELPAIDENNFSPFLYDLLTGSGQYAPFQKMMLVKRYPAVAAALGRSYIDNSVVAGSSYTYILTAVDGSSAESNPLGRTDVLNPSNISLLPAPENFAQVTLSGCDGLRKGMDDNLIRFSWAVPAGPAEMGRSVQTLGYDIFWSESDQGVLNLRNDIAEGLHRINPQPITVSGPVGETDTDGFLAMDRAENHSTLLPEWKRGQTYWYYLVPIDILGRYGETSGPLAATVVDAQPPRAVWGAETTEIRDPTDPLLPRLALSWDRMDRTNFVREYGMGKTICSADPQSVCYVEGKKTCRRAKNITCEDFDVTAYHVFRYNSPEEAMAGSGTDSDGDLWIDQLDTDPCDPAVHPAGAPEHLVATINAALHENEVEAAPRHVKINYVDMDIGQEQRGKVYWYRVVAVDQTGNAGAVSPPIRGILYNRTQPVAQSFMQVQTCLDETIFLANETCSQTPAPDDLLLFADQGKQAGRYTIWKQCPDGKSLLATGDMEAGEVTHVSESAFSSYDCKDPAPCSDDSTGSYYVTYYDQLGSYLSRSDLTLGDLCSPVYQGCVALNRNCSWENVITDGGPGLVPEEGRVRVCVDLEDGQMARLYQNTGSNNSPFAYVTTDGCDFSGDLICTPCGELEKPRGLTAADYCLGVRVFSKDHVGSGMQHLGCLEMPSLPRADTATPIPAPMLASVDSSSTGPAFDVRWAAQWSAAEAFTLLYHSDTEPRVVSITKVEPDSGYQFWYHLPLDSDDLDKKWCFKLQAINSAMETSPWSNEICAVYETSPPEESLTWPHVTLPPVLTDQLTAFYMETAPDEKDEGVPVIVLSEDLSARLTAENSGCVDDLINCPGADPKIPCLDGTGQSVNGCRLCDLARSSMLLDHFIVYRQVEGEDFIQVGPLVEKIHCVIDDTGTVRVDTLDDPFVYLIDIKSGAVAGGVDPAGVTGARLIFRDRYPHMIGSRVRYKVLLIDPGTGEIKQVQESNWVEIPQDQPVT